jgi:transcriptional regulator with XRE-family HTH domain
MEQNPESLSDERSKRARSLREQLNLSQQEFGERLGRTQGLITMIENGRRWFSRDIKEKLVTVFQVSLAWLEAGEGDMFLPAAAEPELRKKDNPVPMQVLVVPVDPEGEERVLVVPDFAMASYSGNYQDTDYISDLPTETVPHDLHGRGTVAKFQVYGESMEPNFHHGDSVYCTFVEVRSYEDFRYKLRNGYVYVIVAEGKAPMLKRLYYHDGDEFIQCYSDNADQRAFAPFAIHLSEVRQLWYWRRTYTAQAPRPTVRQDEVTELKRGLFEANRKVDELHDSLKNINRFLMDNNSGRPQN